MKSSIRTAEPTAMRASAATRAIPEVRSLRRITLLVMAQHNPGSLQPPPPPFPPPLPPPLPPPFPPPLPPPFPPPLPPPFPLPPPLPLPPSSPGPSSTGPPPPTQPPPSPPPCSSHTRTLVTGRREFPKPVSSMYDVYSRATPVSSSVVASVMRRRLSSNFLPLSSYVG